MALESKLQKKVISHLKTHGWLVTKIKLSSMNGWPDVLALRSKPKIVIFIECKAKGKTLEPLQEHVHQQIKLYGGTVLVVDDFENFKEDLWRVK